MGRQRSHGRKDRALVVRAHAKIAPQRGDGESRAKMLPERFVRTGDGGEKRRLEHRLEPLHANLRVPEHTLKVRIERAQIEERFVDVENEDTLHVGSTSGSSAGAFGRGATGRKSSGRDHWSQSVGR